jgi:SagB-type dehydrogenase family enzyme
MADETGKPSVRSTYFLGWGDHGRPDEDDPAEAYHEASKNLPSVAPLSVSGASALATDAQAQATISRPVKRHPGLPMVALPAARYPDTSFELLLRERRSRRRFGADPVSLQDLSTLLHATYGTTQEGAAGGLHPIRSVPSAGGLYPLEIYPVLRNVEGLAPGLYHYDPLRHLLEVLREQETTEPLGEMMIRLPEIPDVAATCAFVIFVVGIFWRTRFKYALRGYRWVLIEAGHVGQNAVLAAEMLGLSAVPYGGLWDRRVDAFLGLDGVNESVVYSLAAGSPLAGEDGAERSFS